MALYSNSRAYLIEQMLRLPLQNWKGGVVDSGSTSTVVDDERPEADDFFQETVPVSVVRIVSTTDGQAPKGEQRRATDYTHSTGTITISSDKLFTVAPEAGDTYAILSEYQWDELVAAINSVIDGLPKRALITKLDETVEMQDDTYEYAIPDGFVAIYCLSQEDDDGDYPKPIPPDQYKIIKGATPKIHFYRTDATRIAEDHWLGDTWVEHYLDDGKKLRIEGFARQQRLTSDDDICYLNPNYIIWKASSFVLGARVRGNDYDSYKARCDECEKQAELYVKSLIEEKLPPDTKWVE
jgi:hypothetical protein